MIRVLAYVLRRIVASAFTVVAMITVTFIIFWAIPSTPAQFLYPSSQHLTNYQIKHGNHVLGTDKPKIVQLGGYLAHILRGDFGKQWGGLQVLGTQKVIRNPIGPQLFPATRVTASILFGGAALVLLIALPLGAIAARYRGTVGDKLVGLLTLLAICTHPMVLGLILRTVFGDQLHWFPDSGYCTFVNHHFSGGAFAGGVDQSNGALKPCGGPVDWADHLILPWISFALLFLALYTRMSRASVLEVLHEDFVRTARAKGANEARVLGRHVLPNAGLRVLTMIGMEIATAIGVCVYIESAFGMRGLGVMSVNAFFGTSGLDLPVILAVVTMIAVVVVIGNLVVDLLYAFVDPRIGTATMRSRQSIEPTETVVV